MKSCILITFAVMDSLTQIALGIATAELCAGKGMPTKKAFLYGAILGTILDLDIVVGQFLNPVNGVAIHRGLSHSIVFFLFLSPFLGWIITKIEKGKIGLQKAVTLAFLCLLTHVLLDLFTSWGTQLLWPLPQRIAFKTIFVIDPLYTLPLLVCLIIASRKPFPARRKYVWLGVGISSFYLFLTCSLKLYVLEKFKSALNEQNVEYNELIVKPSAFNTILWNANVATADAYLLGDYSLFDSQPITFTRYDKHNDLSQQLAGNPDFEKLKKVSEGWFIVTKKDGLYYFNDLRFGLVNIDPELPQFAFSYVFKEKGGELKAHEVPKQKRDGKALLKKTLTRIKGN